MTNVSRPTEIVPLFESILATWEEQNRGWPPHVGRWWSSYVTRTLRPSPDETVQRVRRFLLSLLPPGERRRYLDRHEFYVTGSAGGVYLIRRGYVANIYRMPDLRCLCAHPPMDGAPVECALVAQVLALRTDELGVMAIAHQS